LSVVRVVDQGTGNIFCVDLYIDPAPGRLVRLTPCGADDYPAGQAFFDRSTGTIDSSFAGPPLAIDVQTGSEPQFIPPYGIYRSVVGMEIGGSGDQQVRATCPYIPDVLASTLC
jgi:hypothetical protein